MKHLDVAVAVIFRDSKILIARRKAGAVLGGFWEFPGGKCEPGETLEECVRREVLEELAMLVQPVMSFTPIKHQYADRLVTLHAFLCTHESGEPKLIACDEIRWVEPRRLRAFEFPPANDRLIADIMVALPGNPSAISTAHPTRVVQQTAPA
jgi:mutator protein MutT